VRWPGSSVVELFAQSAKDPGFLAWCSHTVTCTWLQLGSYQRFLAISIGYQAYRKKNSKNRAGIFVKEFCVNQIYTTGNNSCKYCNSSVAARLKRWGKLVL